MDKFYYGIKLNELNKINNMGVKIFMLLRYKYYKFIFSSIK